MSLNSTISNDQITEIINKFAKQYALEIINMPVLMTRKKTSINNQNLTVEDNRNQFITDANSFMVSPTGTTRPVANKVKPQNRLSQALPQIIDKSLKETSLIVTEEYITAVQKMGEHSPRKYIKDIHKKRVPVFYTAEDKTLTYGSTNNNTVPYGITANLVEMTYKQAMVNAFVGISCYTTFINSGSRNNKGIFAHNDGSFYKNGYLIGLTGSRFENPNEMESIYCKNNFNTYKNLSDPYKNFLDSFNISLTFENIDRQIDSNNYKIRMKDTYYLLIREAIRIGNHVAGEQKSIILQIPGLGLGAWANGQRTLLTQLSYEVIVEILTSLSTSERDLFKYIRFNSHIWYLSEQQDTQINGIQLVYPVKDQFIGFAEKLKNDSSKLIKSPDFNITDGASDILVSSFAWDSVSYVGNEYYIGEYNTSDDPAAACCSKILELGNPIINKNIELRVLRPKPEPEPEPEDEAW